MKIRLNGSIDLYEGGIDFDNLDIELTGENEHAYCECSDKMDFSELVVLDEYLSGMIEDYAEVIEYTDADIKQTLIAMVCEILGL